MTTARAGEFDADDVEVVDESRCCVLASGGPLMDVERVRIEPDGTMLVDCSWEGGRRTFDAKVLRMTCPFNPRKWLA